MANLRHQILGGANTASLQINLKIKITQMGGGTLSQYGRWTLYL